MLTWEVNHFWPVSCVYMFGPIMEVIHVFLVVFLFGVYDVCIAHWLVQNCCDMCIFFPKKKEKKGKGADNNVVNAFKVDGWPPFQHNIRRLVG